MGITRATQWVYLSTVRGWELRELDIFRQAAAIGDLFIKETAKTVPISQATPAVGDDDDEPSIL